MKNEPQHPYVQCHCVNFELKIAFSPPKNIYIYQFAFFQIQFLHRSRYHATINQFIFTLQYHYIHI